MMQQMLLGLGGGGVTGPLENTDLFEAKTYSSGASSVSTNLRLSSEGGLIWMKARDRSYNHSLWSSETLGYDGDPWAAATTCSSTNTGDKYYDHQTNSFPQVSASSYTPGYYNFGTGEGFVNWNFLKAPGFMDIVTFQKTSAGRQGIPHSLGSVPGMIMVKNLDSAEDMYVYHRSLTSNSYYLRFNSYQNEVSNSGVWNAETPSSTEFAVGASLTQNDNYVAYIFAHNDARFGANEDESVVHCGTYTGNGSYQTIDCGFVSTARFLIIKRIDQSGNSALNWFMWDYTRGLGHGADPYLMGNLPDQELVGNKNYAYSASNGFGVQEINGTNNPVVSDNGSKYVFLAIR